MCGEEEELETLKNTKIGFLVEGMVIGEAWKSCNRKYEICVGRLVEIFEPWGGSGRKCDREMVFCAVAASMLSLL